MKVLRSSLVALVVVLGVYAGGAQAALIRFNFEIDFATGGGPLGGTIANGQISVHEAQCPGLVCNGEFTPSGAGPANILHDLQLDIAGAHFTMASDSGFPDFPIIEITNNMLTGIDFLAEAAPGTPGVQLTFFNNLMFGSGSFVSASGEFSFIDQARQVGPAQVPEPGTGILLGAAFLAALATVRRRRSATASA